MVVARHLVQRGRWSVSAVARALSVSRPHLTAHRLAPQRRRVAAPAGDALLLDRIRAITDARASYGYRRVTALLNRRREGGAPRVNAKRVYRAMRAAKLLLPRFTGRVARAHDGKVITAASDMRWCSDGFEVRCLNGQRVHVAFALDCCDREAIAWVAKPAALDGEDIRDLMALSIEGRFGAGTTRLPRPLQWLSDNGPPYTATETRAFGRACGFDVCTTPAYSPESNGMAEAFVKTFKRDYIRVAEPDDIADPESLLAALPGWFDDYNDQHPHRGLAMRSPREFRNAARAA
jgi:transposase InsO family protein